MTKRPTTHLPRPGEYIPVPHGRRNRRLFVPLCGACAFTADTVSPGDEELADCGNCLRIRKKDLTNGS